MGQKESKNSKIEKEVGNGLSISQEHSEHLGPPAVIDHLVLGSSFDAGNRELLDKHDVRYLEYKE